jgi:hypothetical protein
MNHFIGVPVTLPAREEVRLMLLVPRQLRRAGMTGDVPYYGGRLTPAHAYALSHPPRQVAPPPEPPQVAPQPDPRHLGDNLEALQRLLDDGVLNQREYDELRGRVLA